MTNMIMRNKNGVLVWNDDTPVFEMGMMFVELFEHTANDNGFAWGYDVADNTWNLGEPTVEFINNEIDLLADDGWRVIRARMIPTSHPNKFVQSWGPASEYGTAAYWSRVDQTWDKMEAMMDHCAERGIGIMFDIFGVFHCFPDYLFQADNTVRLTDWADSNSSVFTKAVEIVQRFMTRFKNHPAISAWEVLGEADGEAYYGNPPHVGPANQGWRQEYFRPEDVLTDAMLIEYQTNMIAVIREIDDTGRFIGSGTFGQKDITRDDKFFDRYFPLQDPTDGASIHHYENMPMGNRDYSAFKDGLILHRKKSAERGLVSYIGEHGVANDTIYLGQPSHYYSDIEYDAIIDAGIQLSFHWRWMGSSGAVTSQPSSRGVHPNVTWPPAVPQYQTLLSKLEKMHNTPWIPVENLPLPEFSYNLPSTAITTDGVTKYELDMPTRTDGMTVAFWYNPRKATGYGQTVMLSSFDSPGNSVALGDYRFPDGNNGWVFRHTYTGIDFAARLSNGALANIGGIALDVDRQTGNMLEDVWFHVCLQIVSPTETWTNSNYPGEHQPPSVKMFVNGVEKATRYLTDGDNPWVPATISKLVVGGLKESYLESLDGNLMVPATGAIADLKLFNRPLKSSEVYDMYLNNTVPVNSLSGQWSFEGGSLVNSVNGQSGTVIAGSTAYETVSIPTNTQWVDWTYTPPTAETASFLPKRGTTAWIKTETGSEGELYLSTDDYSLYLMDGVTPGGTKLKKKDTRPNRHIGFIHNGIQSYLDNGDDSWFTDIRRIRELGCNYVHTTISSYDDRVLECLNWAIEMYELTVSITAPQSIQTLMGDMSGVVFNSAPEIFSDWAGNTIRDSYIRNNNGAISTQLLANAKTIDTYDSGKGSVYDAHIGKKIEDRAAWDRALWGAIDSGVKTILIDNLDDIINDEYYLRRFTGAVDLFLTTHVSNQSPLNLRPRPNCGTLKFGSQQLNFTGMPRPVEVDEWLGWHGVCFDFWLRTDSKSSDNSGVEVIGKYTTDKNYGWWIDITDGKVAFNAKWGQSGAGRQTVRVESKVPVSASKWTHYIVSTSNVNGITRIYRNGQLDAEVILDVDVHTYTSANSGEFFLNKNGNSDYGIEIANLRFYRKQRVSPIESENLYMRDWIPARERHQRVREEPRVVDWNFYDGNMTATNYVVTSDVPISIESGDSTTTNTFILPKWRTL